MKYFIIVLLFFLPIFASAQTETPIVTFAGKPSGSYLTNEEIKRGKLNIEAREGEIISFIITFFKSVDIEYLCKKTKLCNNAEIFLADLDSGARFYFMSIKIRQPDSSFIYRHLNYYKDTPNAYPKLKKDQTIFDFLTNENKLYAYPSCNSNDTSQYEIISYTIFHYEPGKLDSINIIGNELTQEAKNFSYYYKCGFVGNILTKDLTNDTIIQLPDISFKSKVQYKILKTDVPIHKNKLENILKTQLSVFWIEIKNRNIGMNCDILSNKIVFKYLNMIENTYENPIFVQLAQNDYVFHYLFKITDKYYVLEEAY